MAGDTLGEILRGVAQGQTLSEAVKASAKPAAVPAAPPLRPGDSGWDLVPKPDVADVVPSSGHPAPAAAPAAGPRPGEKGFDIMAVPGAAIPQASAPVPAPAPAPHGKPAPPKPLLQQIADSNSSIEQANALASGKPFVSGDVARKIAASNESIDAARQSGAAPLAFVDSGAGTSETIAPTVAPTVVPAHEVPLVNPKRQAAEQEAYGAKKQTIIGDQEAAVEGEKNAEDQLADARTAQANAKAEGDQKIAAASDDAKFDTQGRALANKERQDAFLSKLDAFSQDLANDRIGVNASVPRQVTWTLASAFGAIQQGLLHLPTNQIADRIDAQIRQDIDNQKANHAIKRGRLEDMTNLYSFAVKQAHDQDEAARLAHGYALESAKAEAQALADAAGGPVARAEAEKVKAALGEKQAQLATQSADVDIAAVQRGIAENKWVPAGLSGGGTKTVDSKNVFFDPISGKYFAARSEDDKKALVKSVELVGRIQKAAHHYKQTLEDLGFFDKVGGKAEIDSDAMSKARAAHIALLDDIREANAEGGVIREGLIKSGIYEHSIVPPDKITGDAAGQIDVIEQRTKDLYNNTMTTRAPIPVVEAPQPAGTAPKSVPTGQNYAAQPAVAPSSVGFTPAGAKAKGGDVKKEQPYLVGEKGPELVVPDKPGFVLTALQTAALRGAPPTQQQIDTLPKSAVHRFAEKMGIVPARADGGEVLEARTPQSEFTPDPEDDPNGYGRFDMPVRVGPPSTGPQYGYLDSTPNPGAATAPGAENAPQWMRNYMTQQPETDPYARDVRADNHAEAQRILAQSGPQPQIADDGKVTYGDAAKKGDKAPSKLSVAGQQLSGLAAKQAAQSTSDGGIQWRDFAFHPQMRALGGAVGPSISQPGGTSILGPGGGMNVMGSLQANNAAAMQYMKPGFAREAGGSIQRYAEKMGVVPAREEGGALADAAKAVGHALVGPLPSVVGGAVGRALAPAHATAPTPAPRQAAPMPRGDANGVLYTQHSAPSGAAKEVKSLPAPEVKTDDEKQAEMARTIGDHAREDGGRMDKNDPSYAVGPSSPRPQHFDADTYQKMLNALTAVSPKPQVPAKAHGGPIGRGLAASISRDMKKTKKGC